MISFEYLPSSCVGNIPLSTYNVNRELEIISAAGRPENTPLEYSVEIPLFYPGRLHPLQENHILLIFLAILRHPVI